MYFIKKYLLIILWLLVNGSLLAQDQPLKLTPAVKAEVIDSLASALKTNYVYGDTAIRMGNHIKKRLTSGAYNSINNPDDFALALKTDLYAVYRDLHLSFYYDPGYEKALRTNSYTGRVTRSMKYLQDARQHNYGFKNVDVLEGNVGYIAISQFYSLDDQSKIAANTVFNLLKNTNALIIDVRENGGGEAEMVAYICSFFFKERTLLNHYYERKNNVTTSNWTMALPDSAFFSPKPIYVLVNRCTGSAAEEFAYDLQSLHRAVVVGETTVGAAHWTNSVSVNNGFVVNMPHKRAVNPVTGTNWEKVGVKPDIGVASYKALETAQLRFFNEQISTAKDSDMVQSAKWLRIRFFAKLHSFKINPILLKAYTGNYENRQIALKNNKLYFTPPLGFHNEILTPISETDFIFGQQKVVFHKDKKGMVNEMDLIGTDGKAIKLKRNK
jgi:hypothetical protein